MKLIKKDCGKHYGTKGGACSKCPYLQKQQAEFRKAGVIQYGGTPWLALLQETENGTNGEMPKQES